MEYPSQTLAEPLRLSLFPCAKSAAGALDGWKEKIIKVHRKKKWRKR
jgi:hypothetical protein